MSVDQPGDENVEENQEAPRLPPFKEILTSYAAAFKELSAVLNPDIPGNRCISYIMAMVLPPNEEDNLSERLHLDVKIGSLQSVTLAFSSAAAILIKHRGATDMETMRKWIDSIRYTAEGQQGAGDVADVTHGEIEQDEDLESAMYGMDTNIMNLTTVLQRMNYTGSWLFAMEHVTDEKTYRNVHGGGLSSTMPTVAFIKHVLSNIDVETGGLDERAVRQSIVAEKGIFEQGVSAEEEILDNIYNFGCPDELQHPEAMEFEDGDVDVGEDVLRQLEELEAIERQTENTPSAMITE